MAEGGRQLSAGQARERALLPHGQAKQRGETGSQHRERSGFRYVIRAATAARTTVEDSAKR